MIPTSPAISVESLSLRFPRRWRQAAVDALIDLDLQVDRSEVVGLLGPNGSGKTSLFRVLCNELRATAGRARILGHRPGSRELVRSVGYQPEGPLPFPRLSGPEFLHYLGSLMGIDHARQRSSELLERLGLRHAGRRPIGKYSTGMARRLALAAALLAKPEVLLLDEPTAGLDPDGSLACLELLAEFRSNGGAVLIASHHLEEIEQICDRVYLVRHGRCVAAGSLDDLLGTETSQLLVTGLGQSGQAEVEAAALHAGGEVIGWRRTRRQLAALFRDHGEDRR